MIEFTTSSDFLGRAFDGLVSWWLQSIVLAAMGLAMGFLVGKRSSVLQSTVYRLTLVAVLVSPIFALISVGTREATRMAQGAAVLSPASGVGSRSKVGEIDESLQALRAGSSSFVSETDSAAALRNGPLDTRTQSRIDQYEPNVELSGQGNLVTSPSRKIDVAIPIWIWAIGTLALLARLGWRFASAKRVVRSAVPADSDSIAICGKVAKQLGVRNPTVSVSPYVSSPCLLGYLHPAVVLPEESNAHSQREVFLHELAHLKRADWLWSIAFEISIAILWCQPLLWIVRREHGSSAEDVCDDVVIENGGERFAYADALTAIASLAQPARLGVALPMLSTKSALKRRVARILDPGRFASTVLTRKARLLAVSVAAFAVSLIALSTSLLPRLAVAFEPVQTQSSDDASENPLRVNASSYDPERQFRFSGQVLKPDGTPAENAKVFLVYWEMGQRPRASIIEPHANCDSQGNFQFSVERGMHGLPIGGTLVATLEGYAFAWAAAAAKEPSAKQLERFWSATPAVSNLLEYDKRPMRLLPDDAALSGTVVDVDGSPVSGVKVWVAGVLGDTENSMTTWDNLSQDSDFTASELEQTLTRHLYGPTVGMLTTAVTNSEGRFELRRLGKNRIVRLVLQGPGIATRTVYARTSGGEELTIPETQQLVNGYRVVGDKRTYYGNRFTVVAEPSRAVTGQITDAEGNGVEGATVTSRRAVTETATSKDGPRVSGSDLAFAKTDSDGNYRLEGLPMAKNTFLIALPPSSKPLLSASSRVDTSNDDFTQGAPLEDVVENIQLPRGQYFRGKVVDKKSGAGVPGAFVFYNDPRAIVTSAFVRQNSLIHTDPEGSFEIVIPKEPGAIAFRAQEYDHYRKSDGQIAPTLPIPPRYNLVLVRKGDENDEDTFHELRLESSSLRSGVAVGPDQKPLSDLLVIPDSTAIRWKRNSGTRIVFDSDVDFPRIVVVHRETQQAGTLFMQPGRGRDIANEFHVKLRKWATIKGRIVDSDGEPVGGVDIFAGKRLILASPEERRIEPPPMPLPPADESGTIDYKTDNEGRFEISGFVPGAAYDLIASESFLEISGKVASDLILAEGETKDLGDIVVKEN